MKLPLIEQTGRHLVFAATGPRKEGLPQISKLFGHKTIEVAMNTYAKSVEQGQALGFGPPQRRCGMAPLWTKAKAKSVCEKM